MRLIIKLKDVSYKDGGQILTSAEYIPRKGDSLYWDDKLYNVVDVQWFMSGNGFEKGLVLNKVVIEPIIK